MTRPNQRRLGRVFVAGGFGLLGALGLARGEARAEEPVGVSIAPVVYGVDDRREWYEIPNVGMQDLARQSIVALVQDVSLDFLSPTSKWPPFTQVVGTLDDYVTTAYGAPLCLGERYASQPSASICSGTLIDTDLVLTAGHCVPTQIDCDQTRLVFDYLETSAGVLESIDGDDVYGCSRVLVYSEVATPHLDYAIIQLDRPVVGRSPASVRTVATPLAVATPLVVLGFGSGVPLKYDDGGEVVDARAADLDTFVASTDTFGGNSGSGVFTDDGTLVGILVSGSADYVPDPGGTDCMTVNVLDASAADEESTYAFHPIDDLCAAGFPSVVCPANPEPVCGDAFCSGGETEVTCAADCAGLHCADGICSPSEGETFESCPFDCTTPSRAKRGRCDVGMAGATDPSSSGWVRASMVLLAMLVVFARRLRMAARRA